MVRAWSHADGVRARSGARLSPGGVRGIAGAARGSYVDDDRWGSLISVVARDGRLWLHNAEPLTPLPDGSWRIGADEWSPERVRFDGLIGGRPTRVLLSGSPYVRRFS